MRGTPRSRRFKKKTFKNEGLEKNESLSGKRKIIRVPLCPQDFRNADSAKFFFIPKILRNDNSFPSPDKKKITFL